MNAAFRIIDANLNRIGEGLRVLEDIARFALDDAAITAQLKSLRHDLVELDWPLQQQLLQRRDAAADVGVDIGAAGQDGHPDLAATVMANARRVQQSLRVLAEMSRMTGVGLSPEKFEKARFELYTLEQSLVLRLVRQDRLNKLSGLYLILDTQALGGRSHTAVAGQAIKGGARVIQLRDKVHSKRELLPIAAELKQLCAGHDVLFIVNDYLDLALAVDADGLHLGQDDLPPETARKLLPVDKLLGVSARTVERARAALAAGADYIGVGAMYPTRSKEQAEVVGLERLRQVRRAVTVPIVAIGGITGDNAVEVMEAGASAVAVINAVLGAEDVEAAARRIAERLEGERVG
ncbi:MAG: thiamine phosphate synthase [Chloroflexi bacterium]|nr:thiamine phosphate synthase [Chloroflexota bacterium]